MKNRNVGLIVGVIFLTVGIGLSGVGAYSFLSTQSFIKTATEVPGAITDLRLSNSTSNGRNSTSYYPAFHFTALDGQEVEIVSNNGSNPPRFRVGEEVKVLYDPADPYTAKIKSFSELWLFSIIFGGIGFIFLIIGGSLTITQVRKRMLKKWLLANGTIIQTTFQKVELNESVKVNGVSPYQITSQWQNPADNNVYTFISDDIWFNPEQYAKDKPIPVRIDRTNPARYVTDLSFLPPQGN